MSERKRRKKINGEYGIDIVFTGGEKKCGFFQMSPMHVVKGMEQWDQS